MLKLMVKLNLIIKKYNFKMKIIKLILTIKKINIKNKHKSNKLHCNRFRNIFQTAEKRNHNF